jgi:hypothetical protein
MPTGIERANKAGPYMHGCQRSGLSFPGKGEEEEATRNSGYTHRQNTLVRTLYTAHSASLETSSYVYDVV